MSRFDDMIDVVMDLEPSAVLDLALSSCEVRADLESENPAAWDAWKSLAAKLEELRTRAVELEALSRIARDGD